MVTKKYRIYAAFGVSQTPNDKRGSRESRFTGHGKKGLCPRGQNGVFHSLPGFCVTGGSCMWSGVRRHPGSVSKTVPVTALRNQGQKAPCHAGRRATAFYGAGRAFSGGR